MFNINRFKLDIYLKSGQIMKVSVKSYDVRESSEGITRYKFVGLHPRISLPTENITAIRYRRSMFWEFLAWLWN